MADLHWRFVSGVRLFELRSYVSYPLYGQYVSLGRFPSYNSGHIDFWTICFIRLQELPTRRCKRLFLHKRYEAILFSQSLNKFVFSFFLGPEDVNCISHRYTVGKASVFVATVRASSKFIVLLSRHMSKFSSLIPWHNLRYFCLCLSDFPHHQGIFLHFISQGLHLQFHIPNPGSGSNENLAVFLRLHIHSKPSYPAIIFTVSHRVFLFLLVVCNRLKKLFIAHSGSWHCIICHMVDVRYINTNEIHTLLPFQSLLIDPACKCIIEMASGYFRSRHHWPPLLWCLADPFWEGEAS